MSQPLNIQPVPPSVDAARSHLPNPSTWLRGTKAPPRPAAAAKETPTAPPRNSSGPPPLPSLDSEHEAPELQAELVEVALEAPDAPDASTRVMTMDAALANALASCATREVIAPPSPNASSRDEIRAFVRAAQEAVSELDHMLREIERRLANSGKW